MPKTFFEMAPTGKTTIYVTWRDKRGEQADVPHQFRSDRGACR